jgi:hypothetical protein
MVTEREDNVKQTYYWVSLFVVFGDQLHPTCFPYTSPLIATGMFPETLLMISYPCFVWCILRTLY